MPLNPSRRRNQFDVVNQVHRQLRRRQLAVRIPGDLPEHVAADCKEEPIASAGRSRECVAYPSSFRNGVSSPEIVARSLWQRRITSPQVTCIWNKRRRNGGIGRSSIPESDYFPNVSAHVFDFVPAFCSSMRARASWPRPVPGSRAGINWLIFSLPVPDIRFTANAASVDINEYFNLLLKKYLAFKPGRGSGSWQSTPGMAESRARGPRKTTGCTTRQQPGCRDRRMTRSSI